MKYSCQVLGEGNPSSPAAPGQGYPLGKDQDKGTLIPLEQDQDSGTPQ